MTVLADAAVLVVAVFFLAMGVVALARPEQVVAKFGTTSLSVDGRNEVRAVYGGFGIAVALLLVASLRMPALRDGVLVAVSVALFGMAAGRLVSRAVDGRAGAYPRLFFAIEVALGTVLAIALTLDAREGV